MNGDVATDSSLARLFGILETHNPNLLELLKAETEEAFVVATEGALEHGTARPLRAPFARLARRFSVRQ